MQEQLTELYNHCEGIHDGSLDFDTYAKTNIEPLMLAQGCDVGGNGDPVGAVAVMLMIAICLCGPAGVAYHCLQQKGRNDGLEPKPMLWMVAVAFCCILGPCIAWIPFAMDSMYRQKAGHGHGMQVHVQQQQWQQQPQQQQWMQPQQFQQQSQQQWMQQPGFVVQAQPVMANAIQAQPVMATAVIPMAMTAQPQRQAP